MRKRLFLVTGKPGSGKSTASELAAQKLPDTYYFSIGDELRAIGLHHKPSHFSVEIQGYRAELTLHKPVPPHLAVQVFEECVDTSAEHAIIVDGYPQYADRLPMFHDSLTRARATVEAICKIDVSDDIAKARLTHRKQRSVEVTEDDDYIRMRLDGYQKNVVPTIEALTLHYPLRIIDGDQTQEEVANKLIEIIKSYS
jgi:adenylate kinase family enzyme